MKTAALVGAFLIVSFCGCGSNHTAGNPPPMSTSILYANTASGMKAFTVNADGSLSAVAKPLNQNVGPAIAASNAFIFAGDSKLFGTYIDPFQANFPSGALNPISPVGFPRIGGANVNLLASCGAELIAGDDLGGLVVYSVSANGSLSQAGAFVGFVGTPWNVVVDKTCSHVYVSDTATANIYAFQNTNGSLSDLPGSPFPAGHAASGKGLHGLSVDPSGKFLYVVNQTEGNVYGFAVGSDGTLSPLNSSPWPTGTTPVAALTVSVSSANLLYVTDVAAGTITSYRIDTTGALSLGSKINAGWAPEFLTSFGTLLYSMNVQDSSIDGFQLKSDGSMTRAPGSPFMLGSQPLGSAIVVTGSN